LILWRASASLPRSGADAAASPGIDEAWHSAAAVPKGGQAWTPARLVK
jgi:hypothetical protein